MTSWASRRLKTVAVRAPLVGEGVTLGIWRCLIEREGCWLRWGACVMCWAGSEESLSPQDEEQRACSRYWEVWDGCSLVDLNPYRLCERLSWPKD
jgi:hypothetical protein